MHRAGPRPVGASGFRLWLANEVQPTQTVAEMVRADERLKEAFPRIRLPLLVLHGTDDHATKPSGSRLFHELAGSVDKTLVLYDGHFHDLLRDLDKERVMADINAWIAAHLPRTAERATPVM